MALAPYPWLEEAARDLNAIRDELPNAILFYGARGAGAFDLARAFAKSLLCEHPAPDGTPCGECAGCHLVAAGTHPDLKVVVSEYLAGVYDIPYTKPENSSSSKPSREIRIHQFRALIPFFNMAAHQGGRRVVVVYPADMIRSEAAASLLKSIEEPPQGMVFLLVADDIDEVLPTIRSRSRLFRIGLPSRAEALDWLGTKKRVKDPASALALAGGSPLTAVEDVTGLEADEKTRKALIALLEKGASLSPDEIVRAHVAPLSKMGSPALAHFMVRWTYDLVAVRMGLAPRYFVDEAELFSRLVEGTSLPALMGFFEEVQDMKRSAEHPLAAKSVFESVLFRYSAALMKPRR